MAGIFLLRMSMARPKTTARKMICRVFPSEKGVMMFEGMMERSMVKIAWNSPKFCESPEMVTGKKKRQTAVQTTRVK